MRPSCCIPFPGAPGGRVRTALLVFWMVAGVSLVVGARVSGVDIWHPRAELRHLLLPLMKPAVGHAFGSYTVTFPRGGNTVDVRPREDPPDGVYDLWGEGAKTLCEHLSRIAPAVPVSVRVLDREGQVRYAAMYEP